MGRAPRLGGIHVIPWKSTEIDHEADGPPGLLVAGATWRWQGDAVRVDGPAGTLLLQGAAGQAALRARAARGARRLLGPEAAEGAPLGWLADGGDDDLPETGAGFAVTDGYACYTAQVLAGGRLVAFCAGLPRPGVEHWVVRSFGDLAALAPAPVPGVICFTPGTWIATPAGARAVEALLPGDRVLTRDDGPQEVIWTGRRAFGAAELAAMPALRPIRIRAGALGGARPLRDLVVSPAHRILLRGPAAEALYNAPEVLVRAVDLLNDRTVLRDHAARSASYVHLLLERHQILLADGVETESFHPAHAALDALSPDQHAALLSACPALAAGAHAYGEPARRCLGGAEAAILRADAGWPH